MPDSTMFAARSPAAALVSIVIPVFNGSDFLAEAIESALAQTWPSIEVIVVDDGSNDGGRTRAIADSYGSRIRLVTKPNGGVASALNAGIEAMRGEWFSWLSHDDLYHPCKVERQMEALGRAPAGHIAFGDYWVIDAAGHVCATAVSTAGFDGDRPLWTILEGKINGCTLLIPRVMLIESRGFDAGLPTTQDYELWFRLLRRYRLLPVPGALVSHRVHPQQGSRHPRHLEEASLLWSEMAGSLTPAEMRHYAGSELAFLYRVARFLEGTGFRAGSEAVRQMILARLATTPVTLLWVGQGRPGPARTMAILVEAGLRTITCVVADQSADAVESLELRRATPDGAACVKLDSRAGLADMLSAALAAGPAEVILLADIATHLDYQDWRRSLGAVLGGSCDGWLQVNQAEDGPIPAAFRGAVLARHAVAATLARSAACGSDAALVLGLVARLAHAPSASGVPIAGEIAGQPQNTHPESAPDHHKPPMVPADLPTGTPPTADTAPATGAEASELALPSSVACGNSRESPQAPVHATEHGADSVPLTVERVAAGGPPPPPTRGPCPPLLATLWGTRLLGQILRLHHGVPILAGRVGPAVATVLGIRWLVHTEAYLAVNRDVAAAGFDPILHYLRFGWREGRDPRPWSPSLRPRPALAATRIGTWLLDASINGRNRAPGASRWLGNVLTRICGGHWLVDRRTYGTYYPDVPAAGIDPVLHYLRFGWREGRTPRPPAPVASPAAVPAAAAAPVDAPAAHAAHSGAGNAAATPAGDGDLASAVTTASVAPAFNFDPVAAVGQPDALAPSAADGAGTPADPAGTPPEPAPAVAAAAAPAAVAVARPPAPARLIVLDASDRNASRYAELIAVSLRRLDIRPLFAWGLKDGMLALGTSDLADPDTRFDMPGDVDAAVGALKDLGVAHADVMHGPGIGCQLPALLRRLNVPYTLTFLDHGPVGDGGLVTGAIVHQVAKGASRLLACSRDLAASFKRLAPGLDVIPVRPPERIRPESYRVTPPVAPGDADPLRILSLGDLVPRRGRDEILATATEARRRGLKLEFHHLGNCDPPISPPEQMAAALHLHGPVRREDLGVVVGILRPHVAWFPVQAPEAWDFALSDVMLVGLPVLARALGAYPERLAGRAFTWLAPAEERSTDAWLARLLSLRDSGLRLPPDAAVRGTLPPIAEDFYDARYAALCPAR